MQSVQPRDTYWFSSNVARDIALTSYMLIATELAYRFTGTTPSIATRINVLLFGLLPRDPKTLLPTTPIALLPFVTLIAAQEGIFPFGPEESLFGLFNKSICLSVVSPGDPYKVCDSYNSTPIMNTFFFFFILPWKTYTRSNAGGKFQILLTTRTSAGNRLSSSSRLRETPHLPGVPLRGRWD